MSGTCECPVKYHLQPWGSPGGPPHERYRVHLDEPIPVGSHCEKCGKPFHEPEAGREGSSRPVDGAADCALSSTERRT